MKKKILALTTILSLIVLIMAPAAVFAQGPVTTSAPPVSVSGSIGATYSITPPAPISLGSFTVAQAYTSSPASVTVYTNDPSKTTVTITVSDTKANTKGYLTLNGADTIGTGLTNSLTVKGGAIAAYSPLSTNQTLRSAVSIGTAGIADFSVQQTITAGDLSKASGSYSLTMTFTATFN